MRSVGAREVGIGDGRVGSVGERGWRVEDGVWIGGEERSDGGGEEGDVVVVV